MNTFTKLEPKIYKIIKKPNKDSPGYDLAYIADRYTVKSKLYGIVNKLIPRICRLITRKLFNYISIIATGGKGLGKTTAMNKICNILLDADIPIIEVSYVEPDIALIDFLSDFRNTCIKIDEFAKYFNNNNTLQEKMLTLLNRKDDYFNVFILGENERNSISRYILDRMERARYNLHLSRIGNDEMKEYCADHKLSTDITNNLLAINKTSSKISYDTLDALVVESRIFPELSFDELVEVMNIKGILGIPVLNILEVTLLDNDDYYVVSNEVMYGYERTRYSKFMEEGYGYGISIKLAKIKKDEDEKKETEIPQQRPVMSMGYGGMFGGNDNSNTTVSIRISNSDVISIDDIDGMVTLERKENRYKFRILMNTITMTID